MRIEAGVSANRHFSELAEGDCFEYENKAYMKVVPVVALGEHSWASPAECAYNAVNLRYGKFHRFVEGQLVMFKKDACITLEMPKCP